MGMKQIIVMMVAVVLVVGCGEKEQAKATPDASANELFVEAVLLIKSGDEQIGEEAIKDYEKGLANIQTIIANYSESDLAVKLISGETLFTGKSLEEIRERVKELKQKVVESKKPENKMITVAIYRTSKPSGKKELVRVGGKNWMTSEDAEGRWWYNTGEVVIEGKEYIDVRGVAETPAAIKSVEAYLKQTGAFKAAFHWKTQKEKYGALANHASHMRNIGTLLALYQDDNEGYLPKADEWSDAIKPYDSEEDWLRELLDHKKHRGVSLAFNSSFSKARIADGDVTKMVLVFTSKKGGWNMSSIKAEAENINGGGTEDFCVVLFADFHVEILKLTPELKEDLIWERKKE